MSITTRMQYFVAVLPDLAFHFHAGTSVEITVTIMTIARQRLTIHVSAKTQNRNCVLCRPCCD
jgi:hypothetical protein